MDDLSVMAYEMRKDVLDMICRAGTGHIGGDFSVMEILTDLYFRQMNISPWSLWMTGTGIVLSIARHSVKLLCGSGQKGFLT